MEIFKAGVYARISVAESNDNQDSTSITNQKSMINDYCEKNNIEIYDYYIDDGYSGGNFNRPAFIRMLNDIKNGLINLVITKDISRLGRDFIGTSNCIYKVFPENNVRYIAILDQYDSYIPSISDDIIPFKTVLNDMYLKDISTKIKSSRHELMRKGYFMGSTVPYGYKRSDKDSRILEVDSFASLIVKKIFMMCEAGISPSAIARTLNREGVYPPNVYNNRGSLTDALWTSSTVNYILKNPVYLGDLIQRKYERVNLKSKKKRVLKSDEWIKVTNNHDAIIDEYLFEKVNKKEHTFRHKKYDYLLKGLVKCFDCKKNMIVRRTPSGVIYCCSTYAKYGSSVCSMHYFREDKLNEYIKDSLNELLKKIDIKSILLCIVDDIKNDEYLNNSLVSIKKSIDDENKVLVSLYKDKANKVLSKNDYFMIKESIEKGINLKKAKYDKIFNNYKLVESNIISIYHNFIKLNEKYFYMSLIENVIIKDNKDIEIHYRFRGL